MSMIINKELPNPAALKAEFPVPEHIKEIKAARDKEIAAVFRGESDKFLVIVGPCSADNEESVCEYTRRLARVNEQVKDRLILIPRIYTNKPRTTGEGYKGMPLTCSAASSPSAKCTCAPLRRPVSHAQTKCCTPKTAAIWMTFCPMKPSARARSKTSSTVSLQAPWISPPA